MPEFTLLLPVGISFYTFQAVGYTMDVYRGKIKAEKNLGIYALFVSFFPQLVAGPIERTENLLPQFYRHHTFDYNKAVSGAKLMIWGYFMKVVVADRLALYVDSVYNNADLHNGTSLLLATVFFAFQIYCDFGGYSNIAIGCAKIMGFDLMTNFKRPYFSTTIQEFWQRWHISLSTWFRYYLYIPLGGNRVSKYRNYWNVFVTFAVSGLWHGAAWTFVIWGALNGIYQIVEKSFKNAKNKINETSILRKTTNIFITFLLTCFAWIFFRANSISDAFVIIKKIIVSHGKLYIGDSIAFFIYSLFGIGVLLAVDFRVEFLKRKNPMPITSRIIRYAWYTSLVIFILLVGVLDGGQFIYFQF